jgi:hypothetical protein
LKIAPEVMHFEHYDRPKKQKLSLKLRPINWFIHFFSSCNIANTQFPSWIYVDVFFYWILNILNLIDKKSTIQNHQSFPLPFFVLLVIKFMQAVP